MADHLARFLTLASPSGRDGLDEKLARAESMDLLAEKLKDPHGAAVGGYFLVQQRSQTLPFDWLQRLSDRVPWLADGPILYAYAMLAFRQRDAASEAQHYLREAALRAYPVFRRGIELYLDACRMLESSKVTLQPEIESGSERFAQVRAADTRQSAFTTFFGVHPNDPSARRLVNSRAVSSQASSPTVLSVLEAATATKDVALATDLFTGHGSRLL